MSESSAVNLKISPDTPEKFQEETESVIAMSRNLIGAAIDSGNLSYVSIIVGLTHAAAELHAIVSAANGAGEEEMIALVDSIAEDMKNISTSVFKSQCEMMAANASASIDAALER